MLQEWKRKGKKFRHVEKDGEETTELSVKIRAAKFRDLPMSLRILIVNLSLFLIPLLCCLGRIRRTMQQGRGENAVYRYRIFPVGNRGGAAAKP